MILLPLKADVISCVTITIDCPVELKSESVFNTSRPVLEFKAPVGSSANTTFGLLIKALAIPTRCASPPDS